MSRRKRRLYTVSIERTADGPTLKVTTIKDGLDLITRHYNLTGTLRLLCEWKAHPAEIPPAAAIYDRMEEAPQEVEGLTPEQLADVLRYLRGQKRDKTNMAKW